MYHRASELKHIFNENMKGGTGTVEIIRSVNPIDYESPDDCKTHLKTGLFSRKAYA